MCLRSRTACNAPVCIPTAEHFSCLTAPSWHNDGRSRSAILGSVQVGDPGIDHAVWGRAEDMTMSRPPFDVDQNSPGSDLLGQTAAALAAISIIFEKTDPEYALELEAHARDLYA